MKMVLLGNYLFSLILDLDSFTLFCSTLLIPGQFTATIVLPGSRPSPVLALDFFLCPLSIFQLIPLLGSSAD